MKHPYFMNNTPPPDQNSVLTLLGPCAEALSDITRGGKLQPG